MNRNQPVLRDSIDSEELVNKLDKQINSSQGSPIIRIKKRGSGAEDLPKNIKDKPQQNSGGKMDQNAFA